VYTDRLIITCHIFQDGFWTSQYVKEFIPVCTLRTLIEVADILISVSMLMLKGTALMRICDLLMV
jgi:hypothetical protein